MERGIVHCVQWCDTRDMTADGHTKGSIDRDMNMAYNGALLTGQARQNRLNRLRSNRLQGGLPARQLSC
eukprot:909498-Pyramimonas_sp.AAC.1